MRKILVLAAAVAALTLGAAKAEAAAILIQVDFTGGPPPPSDCAGVFGGNFEVCDVGFALDEEVSPIIVKFNVDDPDEFNDEFDTVDGSEFSFGDGSWTYTPGEGDPAVRYWVAKGGNSGFSLFWFVDNTHPDFGSCSPNPTTIDGTEDPLDVPSGAYNLTCLNLALSVTAGTYSVPSGGLSHLSFYDTGGPPPCPDCDPVVPEPASLLLLGTGLAALAVRLRRRKTT